MATSVQQISNNVNAMRQLTPDHLVQQYPGSAPYYGPSACNRLLPNFSATAGVGYSCACPPNAASPVCTPDCATLLPIFQKTAGSTYTCACPVANQTPVCTVQTCSDLLANDQAQAGPSFTCACPTGSTTPVCTRTCGSQLTSYQTQAGSNYACSCPNGSTATTNPVCVPVCGYLETIAQAQDGPNYTCSCPGGATLPGSPACNINCGGVMATNATYQSDANQVCSCPSGTSSLTTPACVPTCGAQAVSQQAADGPNYTCSCPSGNLSTSAPTCAMNCGGLMATNPANQTNANQVCSCPSGTSAVSNPACTPTCGAMLPGYAAAYGSGYTCTCPSGSGSSSPPSCVPLVANYACPPPADAVAWCTVPNLRCSRSGCSSYGTRLAAYPAGQTQICSTAKVCPPGHTVGGRGGGHCNVALVSVTTCTPCYQAASGFGGEYGLNPPAPQTQWLTVGPAYASGGDDCAIGYSCDGGSQQTIAVRAGCAGSYQGSNVAAGLSGLGHIPMPTGWPYGSGSGLTGAVTYPNWGGSVVATPMAYTINCSFNTCSVMVYPADGHGGGALNLSFSVARIE
jgi:hypothetical protein